MISLLRFASNNENTNHRALHPKSSPMEFKSLEAHLLDPSATRTLRVFGDASNVMPLLPTAKTIKNTSTDVSDASLWCPYLDGTSHLNRMADTHAFAPTELRHDTGACPREWKAHNRTLRSAETLSSLDSNKNPAEDCPPANSPWSCFSPERLSAHMLQTVEHQPASAWLSENTVSRPRDATPLVPPGLCLPCHKSAATFGLHSPKGLYGGPHQASEICPASGVIGATAASLFKPTIGGSVGMTGTSLAPGPVIPGVTVGRWCYDDSLPGVLASWTSEWLYDLIIHPHILQGFNFQYHSKPHRPHVCTWVARRLCPMLAKMRNPMQLVIHALWFVRILASDDTCRYANRSFFSVSFFRHLRAHNTWTAEDFMFRVFIICAMIGDKSMNDVAFTTKHWKNLTSIPGATLNALEKIALSLLEWDVVMTHDRWQESLMHFRICIDKSDPFGPIAHLLDELATPGHSNGPPAVREHLSVAQPPLEIIAPQPIRAFTQWQLFVPPEWSPEDDPIVHKKPRTIGIAPGADQHSTALKNGVTAKDLLDMILGSKGAPDFAHLGRSAGTSFYGSFGAGGVRVPQTAKYASARSGGFWISAQG